MSAMPSPPPKRKLTTQEYLAMERAAGHRSEFFNGEMFAMAGGSQWHALITMNVGGELRSRLRGGACRVYSSDLRVHVPSLDSHAYPDVLVICGGARFLEDGQSDTLLNPTLIVEVLSPSTQNWDRSGKFFHYQQIESLREYVLVSQDRPRVDTFARQDDSQRWLYTATEGEEKVLALASLGVDLPLTEIYDGVVLPTPSAPTPGS